METVVLRWTWIASTSQGHWGFWEEEDTLCHTWPLVWAGVQDPLNLQFLLPQGMTAEAGRRPVRGICPGQESGTPSWSGLHDYCSWLQGVSVGRGVG